MCIRAHTRPHPLHWVTAHMVASGWDCGAGLKLDTQSRSPIWLSGTELVEAILAVLPGSWDQVAGLGIEARYSPVGLKRLHGCPKLITWINTCSGW